MRKAIFNIVYDLLPCFKACHESVERYAKRIGADLVWRQSFTNTRKVSPVNHLNYQILAERESMSDLLSVYDKVLAVDGDVLIKNDSPDIFDCHEQGTTYLLDETINGIDYDKQIGGVKGSVEWPVSHNGHDLFYNCGVILADKAQAELFKVIPEEFVYFKDLSLISCEPYYTKRILKHGFNVKPLEQTWNAMIYFKQDGHFLHFANVQDRDELIRAYL